MRLGASRGVRPEIMHQMTPSGQCTHINQNYMKLLLLAQVNLARVRTKIQHNRSACDCDTRATAERSTISGIAQHFLEMTQKRRGICVGLPVFATRVRSTCKYLQRAPNDNEVRVVQDREEAYARMFGATHELHQQPQLFTMHFSPERHKNRKLQGVPPRGHTKTNDCQNTNTNTKMPRGYK